MPEGHTLFRLAQNLNADLADGSALTASSPQGRFEGAAALDGSALTRAYSVGKHLFLEVGGRRVHVHLGLFGRWKRHRLSTPPRSSVRLRLASRRVAWDLTGPTACHFIDDEAYRALLARIGADPLAKGARPQKALARLHSSRRPIGALLLDQSIISGIGNVYRAELLFLLGIHPLTPGRALDAPKLKALWTLARKLLRRGAALNRIVTVTDDAAPRGERLHVYGRRTCLACGTSTQSVLTGGRYISFCPVCQPPPRPQIATSGPAPRRRPVSRGVK